MPFEILKEFCRPFRRDPVLSQTLCAVFVAGLADWILDPGLALRTVPLAGVIPVGCRMRQRGTAPLKQQFISVAHAVCHSPRATFGARSCDETALNPRAVGAYGIDLAVVDPTNVSHRFAQLAACALQRQ